MKTPLRPPDSGYNRTATDECRPVYPGSLVGDGMTGIEDPPRSAYFEDCGRSVDVPVK